MSQEDLLVIYSNLVDQLEEQYSEELKGLKDVVERIPQFEEKLGVRLENISFSITEPYFNIHGDFFMDELVNFDNYRQIEIFTTIYDEDNFIHCIGISGLIYRKIGHCETKVYQTVETG